jgi:hypothetical protein
MKIINFLIDWSEVWPLLIPLAIFMIFRPKGKSVNWLITYIILALLLNTFSVFLVESPHLLPSFLLLDAGNNLYYNLHSLVMVICFSAYIISVRTYKYPKLLNGLIIAYMLFVVVNFIFFESPLLLNTLHFTIGSIVLLIVCLFYFFRSIVDDESNINWLRHPSFIICTGLCLYEVVTFFIWLFIYPLFNKNINYDMKFAQAMMQVYQASFVLFCILLAIGLFRYSRLDNKGAA